eukprot:Nitzschia sp. Nitz4//scaffold57_size113557//88653//90178//NITZ4_004005-RA/size113557-processed-gene-0.18-mRNA-1//1//CDS//3329554888//9379//frame0
MGKMWTTGRLAAARCIQGRLAPSTKTSLRALSSLPEAVHSLPWQFLRAADAANFDADTYQRVDVVYDNESGKPTPSTSRFSQPVSILSTSQEGSDVKVEWSDGVTSTYAADWLQEKVYEFTYNAPDGREYWSGLTEDSVRDSPDFAMDFEDLKSDEGMKRALKAVYKYGILLVKDTPLDDDLTGVALIGAALGGGSAKHIKNTSIVAHHREGDLVTYLDNGTDGPLRTLYGSLWSTNTGGQAEGTSFADSAYGNDGLPLHTDMTYMRDPPGLQIFTMATPAPHGGESTFGDGFAIAEELRRTDPESFKVLSQTIRRYRCVDNETGWNLQASGPVITERNGKLVAIRHNDLDRLPDLPPAGMRDPAEIDAFYEALEKAHAAWDAIIAQDKFRLEMKLRPGETVVVANQRCFHGRRAFSASDEFPRAVMGCYVSQDELSSRFRREGYDDM